MAARPDHMRTGLVYWKLGETMHCAGRHGEALDCHFKALRIWQREYGSAHFETAHLHNNIGLTLRAQGSLKQALEQFRTALDIAQEIKHPDAGKYKANVDALLERDAKQ